MKGLIKRHSSFLTWVLLPSLLLIASVMSVNLVSRPVVSNPGEDCSTDPECIDSTGCFLEFCSLNVDSNGTCVRDVVNTSATNQTCFQCFTCGNGTCEEADASGNPLEDFDNCPQDCTIFGDGNVCEFFTSCNPVRDRCCPRACQGTVQDSTFDADCCDGCGDNQISGTETCDGTALRTGLTPPSGGNACRSDCTYCGDNAVNGGEVCDPSTGSTACTVGGAAGVCNAQCQCTLNCGNGTVDAGEACDPQATPTGCAAGQTCDPTTCQCDGGAVCGNNVVEGTEECDGATCNFIASDGTIIPGVCQLCICIPECQTEGSGCGDDGTNLSAICFSGTGGTGGSSLIPVNMGSFAPWLAAFAIPGAAFVGLKVRRRFRK